MLSCSSVTARELPLRFHLACATRRLQHTAPLPQACCTGLCMCGCSDPTAPSWCSAAARASASAPASGTSRWRSTCSLAKATGRHAAAWGGHRHVRPRLALQHASAPSGSTAAPSHPAANVRPAPLSCSPQGAARGLAEELGIAAAADVLAGPLAPTHRRELRQGADFHDVELVQSYRWGWWWCEGCRAAGGAGRGARGAGLQVGLLLVETG